MPDAGAIHLEMLDLFDKHDFIRLRDTLHADYIYTGPDAAQRTGPDGGIAVCAATLTAFPDFTVTVDHHYRDGDVSVVEFTMRGTHLGPLGKIPATGKTFEFVICAVVEVRDGKIYREREFFDTRSMLKQLGLT